MRRVAVTGMGVICALGENASEYWQGLVAGRSAIAAIQGVDTASFRFHSGAEVRNYDPARHFDAAHQELLDRFAQFAVVAAREAIQQAGITIVPELSSRIGVVVG